VSEPLTYEQTSREPKAAACAAWHVQVSSEKAVVSCADVQVVALDQPTSSKTSLGAVTASASPTYPRRRSSCKIQSSCRRNTTRDLIARNTSHNTRKSKRANQQGGREGTSKVPSPRPTPHIHRSKQYNPRDFPMVISELQTE
jgi:hypothetical protein